METMTLRCGHEGPAIGAPGSYARLREQRRTCGLPRCRSGLPKKFSDRECAAYIYLFDRGIHGWSVDLMTKRVGAMSGKYDGLIEFAQHHGWEG